MYHIRLIKSQSYKGVVAATKAKPDVYLEDKATADIAVASGFFKFVEDDCTEQDSKAADDTELEKMTKAELISYAESKCISLEGRSTKSQILEAIKEALQK